MHRRLRKAMKETPHSFFANSEPLLAKVDRRRNWISRQFVVDVLHQEGAGTHVCFGSLGSVVCVWDVWRAQVHVCVLARWVVWGAGRWVGRRVFWLPGWWEGVNVISDELCALAANVFSTRSNTGPGGGAGVNLTFQFLLSSLDLLHFNFL